MNGGSNVSYFNRMRTLRRKPLSRGMTLLEIMVVITIIGLVMGAVVVAVMPQLSCARQKRVMMDISSLRQALDLYKAKTGKYPQTGDGLQALVSSKQLDQAPKDPWGNDYLYVYEGGKYTITSYGADGAAGGDGDDADLTSAMVKAPCEEAK
jgi:general secretion pathway protein G